jgi:hypothetical protein
VGEATVIDFGDYNGLPDVLHTEGLLPVVDAVWNAGFAEPTVESLRSAESASAPSCLIELPEHAVVSVFQRELPECLAALERRGGRYIVISRDGDARLAHLLKGRELPDCVRHLFAVYAPDGHARVTRMPFALRWRGQIEGLLPSLTLKKERIGRVLCAHLKLHWFGPQHERRTAEKHFTNFERGAVYIAIDGQYPLADDEYKRSLRYFDYVVMASGDGNQEGGIERQAMWEALALGCVPLCTRRQQHWAALPIAIVDRWEDATPEWLDAQYEGIVRRPLDLARMSYWIEQVKAKAGEL